MKRLGVSHIEVILSFVLFVGFVGAVLLFFNPIGGDRLIDSSLDYTMREVEGNTSVEVDIIGVSLDPSSVSEDIFEIQIEGIDSEKNVRCEDDEGVLLNCERLGDIIKLERGFEGFVFLKFSEEFSINSLSWVGVGNPYEIASQTKEEVISEKRFKVLNNSYGDDYFGLIEDFNLPDQVDFEFSLVFSDTDKIEAKGKIALNVNVFSETSRVEVLRESGETVFADLVVRVA